MISQKIRLVFGRSNMPVGSMRSPLLENEGYKQGEDQTVEGERLDQTYAEEHKRPRLVERLGLAVDARDGLSDQVPHPRARPDDRRAGRDAGPDQPGRLDASLTTLK